MPGKRQERVYYGRVGEMSSEEVREVVLLVDCVHEADVASEIVRFFH